MKFFLKKVSFLGSPGTYSCTLARCPCYVSN